jgi:hypothetical protein
VRRGLLIASERIAGYNRPANRPHVDGNLWGFPEKPNSPPTSRITALVFVHFNLAYSLFAAMRIGVSRNSHTTIFLMLTLIHSTPNRPLQYRALSSSAAQSASFQYFPAGVFDENPKVSSFRERWYASYLSEMDEPSLYESAKMNESPTFRFLLLWMNRALCVRLTPSPDGTGVLEAKTLVAEYSGSDTRQPEITIRKVPTVVTIDQMRQFQTLLQKADFWSLKTFEKKPGGLDGFEWVFEGSKHNLYHVVDRWSPKEGDYTQVCRYLMSMSPLTLDERTRNSLP